MLSATGAVTCDIFKLEEEGVHRCLVSLDRTGPDEAATGSVLRTEVYANAGQAIATQTAVVVEDRSHPSLTAEDIAVYDEYGFESEVLVPLIVEDRVVGLVNLYSDRPNGFASSLEYLRGAGHVVAGALEKALLLAALEDRDRIMLELLEIAGLLAQTHDVEELLRSVALRLLAAVHASHCDIYRRDAAGYVCVVSAGRDGFLDWYEGERLGPAASPSSIEGAGGEQASRRGGRGGIRPHGRREGGASPAGHRQRVRHPAGRQRPECRVHRPLRHEAARLA